MGLEIFIIFDADAGKFHYYWQAKRGATKYIRHVLWIGELVVIFGAQKCPVFLGRFTDHILTVSNSATAIVLWGIKEGLTAFFP